MEIRINAQWELLMLILFLSDKRDECSLDEISSPYPMELEKRFGSFRNHPAVTEYPKMFDMDFDGQGLIETVFYLDNDFKISEDAYKDPELKSMYESSLPEILVYLEHVRDLYIKTEFEKFIWEQEIVYQDLISSIKKTMTDKPLNSLLEAYLGVKQPKQRFVLSLLLRPFLGFPHCENGEMESILIISRMLLERAIQYNYFERNVISCFWHEFSHPIINPFTDALFDNSHDMTDEQRAWYCTVNESIIEGINLRLKLRENVINEDFIEHNITNSIRNGAPKVRECADLLLEKYENNRDMYPDIGVFYPEFLPLFGERP